MLKYTRSDRSPGVTPMEAHWTASAVKYDWMAAMTLAQVRQDRQYRYGGAGEINPVFKFHERGRALLFNARWARQAIELASRLGL